MYTFYTLKQARKVGEGAHARVRSAFVKTFFETVTAITEAPKCTKYKFQLNTNFSFEIYTGLHVGSLLRCTDGRHHLPHRVARRENKQLSSPTRLKKYLAMRHFVFSSPRVELSTLQARAKKGLAMTPLLLNRSFPLTSFVLHALCPRIDGVVHPKVSSDSGRQSNTITACIKHDAASFHNSTGFPSDDY